MGRLGRGGPVPRGRARSLEAGFLRLCDAHARAHAGGVVVLVFLASLPPRPPRWIARWACSDEAGLVANSVARGGPPAAACCARTHTPACGEVGWWWISLPPLCRAMRACFAGGRPHADGRRRRASPSRAPRSAWACMQLHTRKRAQAGLACGLPRRGLAARGVPARARRARAMGMSASRALRRAALALQCAARVRAARARAQPKPAQPAGRGKGRAG